MTTTPTTKRNHNTLAKEGNNAGKIIGSKIVKIKDAIADNKMQQLKKVNDLLITKFKSMNLPVHNENTVTKAFEYAIKGDEKKFPTAYRSANPGQDELMSTQTVFSVFSGIGANLASASQTHKDLVKEVFRSLSLTRLPTLLSGYNYSDETNDMIMQHPTSKNDALYDKPGINHGGADLRRREFVVDELNSALATLNNDEDAVNILFDTNIKAAEYTLNNFTAPPVAKNMRIKRSITLSYLQELNNMREAIKYLKEPSSSYLQGSHSWKKGRNARGFSPFRK